MARSVRRVIAATDFYVKSRDWILNSPFRDEVVTYAARRPDTVTEQQFLCETAWVALSSGFRASAVARCFSFVALAFGDFRSAAEIVAKADLCVSIASARFRHPEKLRAVVRAAQLTLDWSSFDAFRNSILGDPEPTLRRIPFIGDVTAKHLARNLGFDVAKPDRHLERLSSRFGFATTAELCRAVSADTGDPVRMIDAVLWRTAVSHEGT